MKKRLKVRARMCLVITLMMMLFNVMCAFATERTDMQTLVSSYDFEFEYDGGTLTCDSDDGSASWNCATKDDGGSGSYSSQIFTTNEGNITVYFASKGELDTFKSNIASLLSAKKKSSSTTDISVDALKNRARSQIDSITNAVQMDVSAEKSAINVNNEVSILLSTLQYVMWIVYIVLMSVNIMSLELLVNYYFDETGQFKKDTIFGFCILPFTKSIVKKNISGSGAGEEQENVYLMFAPPALVSLIMLIIATTLIPGNFIFAIVKWVTGVARF